MKTGENLNRFMLCTTKDRSNLTFSSWNFRNKVVSSEDVQRAIISTEHFDFLTNKNLGVTGVKSKPS